MVFPSATCVCVQMTAQNEAIACSRFPEYKMARRNNLLYGIDPIIGMNIKLYISLSFHAHSCNKSCDAGGASCLCMQYSLVNGFIYQYVIQQSKVVMN